MSKRMNFRFIMKVSGFQTFAAQAVEFSDNLESTLEFYDNLLTDVLENGVSSGRVHDALSFFQRYVKDLIKKADGIGKQLKKLIESFIKSVESADKILYDAGTHMPRDYSDEEYQRLQKVLDNHVLMGLADTDGIDKLIGVIRSTAKYILETFNIQWKGLNDMSVQLNQIALRELTNLFNEENAHDQSYSEKFKLILECMDNVQKQIDSMKELFSSDKEFTIKTVRSKLDPLSKEMSSIYGEVLNIRTVDSIPTVDEIASFSENEQSDEYFGECDDIFNAYEDSISWDHAFLLWLYNGREQIKDRASHFVEYDEYKKRQMLLTQLNEMSKEEHKYDESIEELNESLGTFKKLLEFYQKNGGKTFEEYVKKNRLPDGSIEMEGVIIFSEDFERFSRLLGVAETMMKYGIKSADFLARLLMDYSKGLELVDSLEKNYENDDSFRAQFEEIRRLYQKEWVSWLKEGGYAVGEDVYNIISKDASKVIFGRMYSKIDATISSIEKAGEISGATDQEKAVCDFLYLKEIYVAENQAYQSALKKFRAANPSDPRYENLAEDVRICFNLTKDAAIRTFDAMERSKSWQEQEYYRYCRHKLENANMFDTDALKLMSYDEYIATK